MCEVTGYISRGKAVNMISVLIGILVRQNRNVMVNIDSTVAEPQLYQGWDVLCAIACQTAGRKHYNRKTAKPCCKVVNLPPRQSAPRQLRNA
jgi:hypothetical protein